MQSREAADGTGASERLAVGADAFPPRYPFVAELRMRLGHLDDWPLLRSMLDTASERMTGRRDIVSCLSGTYLPEEGTVLCVFLAPTADAIRKVLAAGNFRPIRVVAAVLLPSIDPTA